jgi:predicted tellurium resistance membrane protein TerC
MIPLAMDLDPSILLTGEGLLQLLTLSVLEIVLGIDNIIVISILSDALPLHQQKKARRLGLSLAMITRILLLLSLSWIMGLEKPLASFASLTLTGRDVVLILGGLFLVYKAGTEIFNKVEMKHEGPSSVRKRGSFAGVVSIIILMDIVFSLDSVITAVGMSTHVPVMILAVIIAVLIMLMASEAIAAFVNRNATVKVLALAFLVLVGLALVLDGFGKHVPKGYLYFAMVFSVLVEGLNLLMRRNERRSQANE